MFVWHQNADSRQQKFINNIKAAAATTFIPGEALYVTAGRWAVALAGGVVGGIYNGSTFTSGANDFIEVVEARPGDEFIADYSGTPDAAFLAGQSTADINANGLSLNAADVIGGAFAILSIDTANSKAVVRVKNRQFS